MRGTLSAARHIRFHGFSSAGDVGDRTVRSRAIWEGVEPQAYRQEGGDFRAIVRHTLMPGGGENAPPAAFELRYFELAPGGYSSLEKHRHVHCAIVLRGVGRALVGERVFELAPFDAVYIPPLTPHRFANAGQEPFGFLCLVDAERDRPQRLSAEEVQALRANPQTAPYATTGLSDPGGSDPGGSDPGGPDAGGLGPGGLDRCECDGGGDPTDPSASGEADSAEVWARSDT